MRKRRDTAHSKRFARFVRLTNLSYTGADALRSGCALTQPFDAPSMPVLAADETVGLSLLKFQFRRIPFQRRLWEPRSHAAEQHSLRERPRITKVRCGLAVAEASLDELLPMVRSWDIGKFEIFELRVRIKQWPGPMRQHQHAFS